MKKVFFILIFVIAAITTQAEPLWYRITGITINVEKSGWSEWKATEIPLCIDLNTKHIEVFTEEVQVFDYTGFQPTKYTEGVIFESLGTDSNYRTVAITLAMYDSGEIFLKISYNDVEYIYNVEFYK